MRFRAKVLEGYPGVHIGVLVGRGLKNASIHPAVEAAKREALEALPGKLGDGPASRHPFIASWREMYRSFGTKAGDYRPSAEALARRALKEGALPRINSAVDAYNAVSVRHLVPMGGFDLDRVRGDIVLRCSEGGEEFTPLGPAAAEETYPGEVVYADDARVLTRRWNYRDCEETKITVGTANVAMFVDGSPAIPRSVVENALNDLEELLRVSCGGEYGSAVACDKMREVALL
ncbi:MAG: phenylalanine--tRNA ligase beta subunit-related protein [Candidatus Bathyarchaeota archaeon]